VIVYRFRVGGDMESAGKLFFLAFKEIDGLEDRFPIEIAGGSKYLGTRRVQVRPVDCRDFNELDEVLPRSVLECKKFLVRIKYSFSRRGGRGYAVSDLYLVVVEARGREILLVFKRLGGLGRTRPAYVVLAIERALSDLAERRKCRGVTIERIWS